MKVISYIQWIVAKEGFRGEFTVGTNFDSYFHLNNRLLLGSVYTHFPPALPTTTIMYVCVTTWGEDACYLSPPLELPYLIRLVVSQQSDLFPLLPASALSCVPPLASVVKSHDLLLSSVNPGECAAIAF